jgi:hypothetical protein
MTIGEIPGFKSKRLRTKNRLPENLVAPANIETFKFIWCFTDF